MKKLIVLAVILVVAALGWWVARPAYRGHKERRFAAQAQAELDQKDYRRAMLTARQVLVLNESNLIACQVMGQMHKRLKKPRKWIPQNHKK